MSDNDIPWQASQRYPDPAIVAIDESFRKVHLPLAKVERLYTGCRWAEGPVLLGDQRALVWSDVPGNRMYHWDEQSGATSVFRAPSNHAMECAMVLAGLPSPSSPSEMKSLMMGMVRSDGLAIAEFAGELDGGGVEDLIRRTPSGAVGAFPAVVSTGSTSSLDQARCARPAPLGPR